MEEDLVKTFERFGRNRAELENLLCEVKKAYTDLNKIKLSTNSDKEQLSLSSAEEDKVRQIFQDPKLVFTGQTNAGKSSLINEILGATVLKADDIPCTSRIAELSYGRNEKPIVTILKEDGTVLETHILATSYIPSGIVNLPDGRRADLELIRSRVYVVMNNAFLKGGVKIVDSPGRNENKTLDSLVEDHMGSVLPLVVYVIDGRGMLSKQDIEDIECLYRTIPSGNVFFVVTKCDDPGIMEDNNSSSDDDSDSDDEPDVNKRLRPTKIETEIRKGVYEKLVDNKFLKDLPIEECKYYHTLSSRYVKKYRLASQKRPQNVETAKTLIECERFMIDFRKFKTSLLEFTRHQLVQTVISATEIIRISLVKYLDYYVGDFNKAKEQSVSNEQNIQELNKKLQNMEMIGDKEIILWNKIQSMVRDAKGEYSDAAKYIVNNKKEEILNLAKTMKVEKFEVPDSGYVARNVLSLRATELAEQVMNKVGSMVHDEVIKKKQVVSRMFHDISDSVEKLQAKMEGTIDNHDALYLMLSNQYKFDLKGAVIQVSLWRRACGYLKSIFTWIFSEVKYDPIKWRVSVAKEQLEVIDTDKLADAVIRGILIHLTDAHNGFCEQLNDMQKVTRERLEAFQTNTRALESGDKLRQSTPRMGRLLLMAWDIQDRLRFGRLNHGETLGGGSRGVVYECDARGPRSQPCAVKVIRLENVEEVGEIGLRLHCYRKIQCEYLAEVFGVHFECIRGNVYEVSILMPRLEKTLLRMLPYISSLRDRLLIARQVSEALACIHKENMIYGNISCTNVLLDADNRVWITDYMDPAVGLPGHVAPEISRQLRTTKVDVYAFGVLLWCICKGEGMSEARDTTGSHRPLERSPEMRDDCWALIDQCLSTEPTARPTMDAVTRDLVQIISVVGCHWE